MTIKRYELEVFYSGEDERNPNMVENLEGTWVKYEEWLKLYREKTKREDDDVKQFLADINEHQMQRDGYEY